MSEQLQAVESLRDTATSDPDEVDIEEALSYLDAESAAIRQGALQTLSAVASEEPDRLEPYVDDVRPYLEDDVVGTQTNAVYVFAFLSKQRPDLVVDSVPQLVDLLDEDPPLLRFRAAGALGNLLATHREAFAPHAEDIVDVLVDGPAFEPPDPDDPEIPDHERERVKRIVEERSTEFTKDKARSDGVFEFAANAVVELAELDVDHVAHRVEELVTVLDFERPIVRTALVDTMSVLAQEDPSLVEPAVDALRERLDDENEYVRAHAVRALGYAEATEAVDDLRELAGEDEAEQELRELAADTADWLEDEA